MSFLTTRRKFLLAGGAGFAALSVYRLAPRPQPVERPVRPGGPYQLLNSLIDTLVPADEFKGALAVGVDQAMQREMQQQPKLSQIMDRLGPIISERALSQHSHPFYTLRLGQREALLNGMLERSAPRQARADLMKLRNKVLAHYYASPEGHASLDYRLPAHYPAYQA